MKILRARRRLRRHILLIAYVMALLAGMNMARAHHGFGGEYNANEPLWVVGTATQLNISHPHPELVLSAQPGVLPTALPQLNTLGGDAVIKQLKLHAVAQAARVRIEFPPVSAFFALNQSVKVSDRVEVIVYRNCLPPHQLRGQWVRAANGGVIARPEGRMQSVVQTCVSR